MQGARHAFLVAAASMLCAGGAAWAQSSMPAGYPTKPIRFVAPFPPGGTSDIIARVAAQKLTETLGRQVLVDNRGGALGTIGYELAAKAPADGYTLLLCSMGGLVTNQFLFMKAADVPEKFGSLGLVPLHSTPERVTELVTKGASQMAQVVKQAGIVTE